MHTRTKRASSNTAGQLCRPLSRQSTGLSAVDWLQAICRLHRPPRRTSGSSRIDPIGSRR